MLQAAADGHSIEAISTSYVAGGILVESYYVLVAATRSHGRMSNVSNMLIALMSLMDGGGTASATRSTDRGTKDRAKIQITSCV